MTTIEIRKRRDGFHAQIKDMPTYCGCGNTEAEAVGNLVKTYPHSFDLEVNSIVHLCKQTDEVAGFLTYKNKKFYQIEIERVPNK